jgi:D-amino-acid dehydrogenase
VTTTLIIGGGIIGLTTALELIRRGHSVTLLDSAEHEGLGASFANAGLLTPSMSDPWNAPGIHRHLIEYLVSSKSALKLRLGALPSLLSWGPRFLLNSSKSRHASATADNLALSSYALKVMSQLEAEYNLRFDGARKGSLKIFRSQQTLDAAFSMAETLAGLGLEAKLFDAAATVACEPQLAPIRGEIAGAIYFPTDGTGDAHQFCRALARIIRSTGGTLQFGTPVQAIEMEKGKATGVRVAGGVLRADRVVVAAGVASPRLLTKAGIRLQLKPVKGYSVTYSFPSSAKLPMLPVIDDAYHAAVTPLGNRLRVAGTAEFAGMDLQLRPQRLANLSRLAQAVYPDLVDARRLAEGVAWAGLRPVTADGRPYIGRGSAEALWVNAGHGHLGWTMAAGAARLLADQIEGRRTDIDVQPYRINR